MMNIDMNYQHIIWSHDELPYEPFVHEGFLNSYTIKPRFTIGLTEYLNITLSQVVGVRQMIWDRDELSAHHRTEDTTTDFTNTLGVQAKGGVFGDFKINLKYLYKNVGMKEGARIYFGAGLVLPSKVVLREDPFKKPENPNNPDSWDSGEYDHRHFSLSNGVYKTTFEAQIFNRPSIMFADLGYQEMGSIKKIDSLDVLPSTINSLLNSKVDLKKLSIYVSSLFKHSFNFDFFGFQIRSGNKFFYNENLVDIEINEDDMKDFLKTEKINLDILADEHIKKIQFYEKNPQKHKRLYSQIIITNKTF